MANKRISRYIEEYQSSMDKMNGTKANDWDGISEALILEHAWTEEGAQHLIHLVRQYGSTAVLSSLTPLRWQLP